MTLNRTSRPSHREAAIRTADIRGHRQRPERIALGPNEPLGQLPQLGLAFGWLRHGYRIRSAAGSRSTV